jgi:predicted amino acid-binding ACT domain protein
MQAERVTVWAGSIEDRPGGLAEVLKELAEAGAELQYVMARRAPDKPGTGVVFLSPVKGAKQTRAAKRMGLHKSKSIYAVRAEGPDKPGLGAAITSALAEKDVNIRGISASVLGRKFVLWMALDSSPDAAKAVRTIKALG